MSADILRRAAAVLRERAEKATPDVWKVWGMSVLADTGHDSDVDKATPVASTTHEAGLRTFNADYIATMHPGVGLIIARGLENHAYDHDAYDCGWAECEFVNAARLILGEATS